MIAKGKLLTLTTEEALQHQLADVRADSLAALRSPWTSRAPTCVWRRRHGPRRWCAS